MMQFLLTEEEYRALKTKVDEAANLPTKEALQNFCTHVAETMPVQSGWAKGRPWGCALTDDDVEYCDECPARFVCPYPHKKASK